MTEQELRQIVSELEFRDWKFSVVEEAWQPFLQVGFSAPCHDTGQIEWQQSRKWRLSYHMTKGEVVQTALLAVLTAVEHETREEFTYRGVPVFQPHVDIDKLLEIATEFAVREPTKG